MLRKRSVQKNSDPLQPLSQSVSRDTPSPKRDRGGKFWFLSNSLILHFRPRNVPVSTLQFPLTWGLGGMALVLIVFLFGSGVLLKFHYQPFPDKAFESIIHLRQNVLFGQFIRNIHYWSGNLLLLVVFLHFLRVFFTGAFQLPRRLNWLIGLCLFLFVLMANFTGYLLPWDQLSFWAVTISTGILEYIPKAGPWLQEFLRGGPEVGAATLANFYAIHTAVLPLLFLSLLPFHFWRVRRAGGVVIPRPYDGDDPLSGEKVPAIPNLIVREVVTALALIALIFVVSALFDAPLGSKANPGLSPNPTKAPWYFMGFQEILLHLHPIMAAFLVPALMIAALAAIPSIPYSFDSSGIWFVSLKGRLTAKLAAVIAWIVTPIGILMDEFIPLPHDWAATLFPGTGYGLILCFVILVSCSVTYPLLKRKYALNRNESVQMLFVFFINVFVILTVTGIWFRGSGMRLKWPWM